MGYRLTKEGKEYLQKGLPEKNLIKLLKSGPLTIEEAEKKVERFNIALLWAKKKGWIELKFNQLVLVKEPESIPEETALRKIEKGEKIEPEILKTLIQRKLVEKVVVGKVDKLVGKKITNLTPELIKTGLWRKVIFKHYRVNVPAPKIYPGKIHPYRQVINQVRKKLINLGFKEVRGPLVELNFWNCDALFMPSDHPARGIHDIFTVKNPKFGKVLDKKLWKRVEATHKRGWVTGSKGWGFWDSTLAKRLILRSHGTAVSARTLAKLKKEDLPCKVFMIDKVFRPDVIDSEHFIEFEHCEGIVVDENVNFVHLLGYLKEIAKIVGAKKVRFKPSYFPFTEPSVELQTYSKELGWVETGGAGIFRPEVTLPLGIDVPVLAWGIGIGRLAMSKLGVKDIRYLYSNDLEWLRNTPIIM